MHDDATILIRRADETDIPAISRLAHAIWPACYGSILPPGQIGYMLSWMYDEATLQRDMRAGACFDFAEACDTPVAFCAHGPDESLSAPPDVWMIHKLYVLADWQRRGIGSRLLAAAEDEARAQGMALLRLHVNRNNLTAIAAYERNGFHTARQVVTDIGNGFVMDDFLMEKTCDAG